MAWVGAVVGGVINLLGSKDASSKAKRRGREIQRMREMEAKQLEQQALREVGVAQLRGIDEMKKAELIASRALAVSAFGGGGSDPTVMNIIADIEGEGAYHQAVELYNGEEAARELRDAAYAKRLEGKMAAQGGQDQARAYQYQAAGSVAQTYSSLYSKYGTPASGAGVN